MKRNRRKKKSSVEVPKLFTIRIYCSECGRLLQESDPMTRKEVLVNWDQAVIGAAYFTCSECGTRVPNFRIDLKVYHKGLDREFDPVDFIPAPEHPLNLDDPEGLINGNVQN